MSVNTVLASLRSFICSQIRRYIHGNFKEDIPSTIAVEFATTEFTVSDGNKIKVVINDTGKSLSSWPRKVPVDNFQFLPKMCWRFDSVRFDAQGNIQQNKKHC